MGIKHMYSYLKTHFAQHIIKLRKGERIRAKIDTLLIDANGIIHGSTQKIYEYGGFAPPANLLSPSAPRKPLRPVKDVYDDICARVEYLIHIVSPKNVVLCIDGVAPLSKQNQQRQRRFRASRERVAHDSNGFNSNAITPGTEFMEGLSEHIKGWIGKRKGVPIAFSSSKEPGEGEHKLLDYVRKHSLTNKNTRYCMHGADADLIMLSLGTQIPNFYILRDEMMGYTFDFNFVSIGGLRQDLIQVMRWDGCVPERVVDDFILMCFLVGNDFLPHVPSIEIVQGSIELMMEIYKRVCSESKEHLSTSRDVLKKFFIEVGAYEKASLDEKMAHKEEYFPSPLLEDCSTPETGVKMPEYKARYYAEKMHAPPDDIPSACEKYVDGIFWVLHYYLNGVSDWKWCYPYHYAPFSSDIGVHMRGGRAPSPTERSVNIPTSPFVQLLCVLPPSSAGLLPPVIGSLFESDLAPFCPIDFAIDTSGCKKEWEAITILPPVDFRMVRRLYRGLLPQLTPAELKRNRNEPLSI